MTERFRPPFRIAQTEEAAWVEDAQGLRFGFVYWRASDLVGTDDSGRLSKALALRTVQWIKRMAEAASGPG